MRIFYVALMVVGMACCASSNAQAQWRYARCDAYYGGGYYGTTTYYYPPVYYARYRSYAPQYFSQQPSYAEPHHGAMATRSRTTYRPPTERQPAGDYAASSARPERPAADAATARIGAYDNYFEPKTITVPPGTTIRWTNVGQHNHTVTSNENLWDSGDMPAGTTYEATFRGEGTYHYYCRHHTRDEMQGTIVVSASASRAENSSSTRPRDGDRPARGTPARRRY